MARRSARLASVNKMAEPAAECTKLGSVAERNASPDISPQSLNAIICSPAPAAAARAPQTPSTSKPVKPSMSEMHPSKVHQTMASPSSVLRLGFTDIKPQRRQEVPAAALATPSKVAPRAASPFEYRYARETTSDLELGPEARRMMEELREDAAKNLAELQAKREMEKLEEAQVNCRKIANPKGKAGRYSAVHMAAFRKMDSIANHPSAFRAQPGRITPGKPALKRTQSKANLDDGNSMRDRAPLKSALKRTQSKASLKEPLSAVVKKPSFLDGARKARSLPQTELAPYKRARQNIADDASTNRPVSRDGSFLPRPKSAGNGSAIPRSKSSSASLRTPTKASLARLSASLKPLSHGPLLNSPGKSNLVGLTPSATMGCLPQVQEGEVVSAAADAQQPLSTSSRLNKVKAMFRSNKMSPAKSTSSLRKPSTQSSNMLSATKIPMAAPMTTPSRKLTKCIVFTPEAHRAAVAQNSPSPIKSGISLSKSRQALGEVNYPTLDSVVADEKDEEQQRPPSQPPVCQSRVESGSATESDEASSDPVGPSTFTFRSDHMIRFERDSHARFGSSAGQASVRQVRSSIPPTADMPGSFPASFGDEPCKSDKENEKPAGRRQGFVAHGIKNKKRYRVSTDEEEEAEAERTAKKRKQEAVPEGEALLAPDLFGGGTRATRSLFSPTKPQKQLNSAPPCTPSPRKKKAVLSMSRLNMLARPRLRK